jgi:hypothetical protein
LLILPLLAIFVGSANAIFDPILVNYTGHVYCTLAIDDGSETFNLKGTLLLPVKNVDLTLVEMDGWFCPDCPSFSAPKLGIVLYIIRFSIPLGEFCANMQKFSTKVAQNKKLGAKKIVH